MGIYYGPYISHVPEAVVCATAATNAIPTMLARALGLVHFLSNTAISCRDHHFVSCCDSQVGFYLLNELQDTNQIPLLLPLSTCLQATRQHAAAWALAKVGDPYAQDFQAMRETS